MIGIDDRAMEQIDALMGFLNGPSFGPVTRAVRATITVRSCFTGTSLCFLFSEPIKHTRYGHF
jgi:hypothetical protein